MTKHFKLFLGALVLGLTLTYIFSPVTSDEVTYIDEARYNDKEVERLIEFELPQ